MEREEELEQTINELNYMLANAFKKIKKLESNIKNAREEIKEYSNRTSDHRQAVAFKSCLALLDSLISESEK